MMGAGIFLGCLVSATHWPRFPGVVEGHFSTGGVTLTCEFCTSSTQCPPGGAKHPFTCCQYRALQACLVLLIHTWCSMHLAIVLHVLHTPATMPTQLAMVLTPVFGVHTCLWHSHLVVTHTCLWCSHLPMVFTPVHMAHTRP